MAEKTYTALYSTQALENPALLATFILERSDHFAQMQATIEIVPSPHVQRRIANEMGLPGHVAAPGDKAPFTAPLDITDPQSPPIASVRFPLFSCIDRGTGEILQAALAVINGEDADFIIGEFLAAFPDSHILSRNCVMDSTEEDERQARPISMARVFELLDRKPRT